LRCISMTSTMSFIDNQQVASSGLSSREPSRLVNFEQPVDVWLRRSPSHALGAGRSAAEPHAFAHIRGFLIWWSPTPSPVITSAFYLTRAGWRDLTFAEQPDPIRPMARPSDRSKPRGATGQGTRRSAIRSARCSPARNTQRISPTLSA
jgi:hypothetical protein